MQHFVLAFLISFLSLPLHAQSTWVPILNDGITVMIPNPEVTVLHSSLSGGDDGVHIQIGAIGATHAFYYRSHSLDTNKKALWQCQTSQQIKKNNGLLQDSLYHSPGRYTYEVSACLTGKGCDIPAFTAKKLICSSPKITSPMTLHNVSGQRTPRPSSRHRDTIGTLNASFRVTELGAASYTVPLELPKGSADVVPTIAFVYNSQSNDSIMGKGWNVSASQMIARCPKTIVMDGKNRGIRFSTSDRLCLNGERLLRDRTSGSVHDRDKKISDAVYWSQYARYHLSTQVGIYVRPHYQAGILKAFTLENKIGEVHYFGDVVGIRGEMRTMTRRVFSRQFKDQKGATEKHVRVKGAIRTSPSFLNSVQYPQKARAWALRAIEDIKGNYIHYVNHYTPSII
jgi:hypothetical protein